MKKPTRQSLLPTLTSLWILACSFLLIKTAAASPGQPEMSFAEAQNLRYSDPDSAILVVGLFYERAIATADTALAIESLMELAWVYGHQADYKQSYDRLWKALLLADHAKMEQRTANIYRAIGRYYSFYNRREKAMQYLKRSLSIKRNLVDKGELNPSNLVQNYHAICATYREMDEPELSKVYLDSCFLYHSSTGSKINRAFLEFEQAVIYNSEQRYDEALANFSRILPWFAETNPGYQVLVYTYLGDTHKFRQDFEKSEECYQKALSLSSTHNSHIDFTPLVHERLASLYFSNREYLKAYSSLETAKNLDAVFFDSRSENNRPLLEIQDAFRTTKEEQERMLKERRLAELEQEEKVRFLERALLLGCIAFLVLFGLLYFNHVRAKHRSEKLVIERQRELEVQKANEIVELKNKELATSALKLIEKDAFMDRLKEQLSQGKGDVKRQEIKQIVRSISNHNVENWKEFETRFVAVNERFYEKLNHRFPKLTRGELKLCALVKLNFSSKEMSKLLGISLESVHTTRHRLRKKLNLSRDTNLTEFIANV